MNKLQYGELPLHIRLLFILICMSGGSAILLAFMQLGVNISSDTNGIYLSLGIAIVAMLTPMKYLLYKSRTKLIKAILFLIAVPVCYLSIIILENSYYSEIKNLVFWWPVVNSFLFLMCVAVLVNKKTFRFYSESV